MFKILEREDTLASRVTDQVENLIVERHFQPGDRLPAERELAARFGVSRTVIREAVRALVAKGMLAVKPGSGSVVRTPSAEAVTQSMSLFLRGDQPELDYKKVIEVRRLLEIEIAGLAAERHTDEDLKEMERILAESDGIHDNRERFVEWDVAFHSALARATHNKLLSLLLESVAGTMRKVREIGFDNPDAYDQALRFHKSIFVQIKRGNPRAAREAMREHLVEAEETMRKALEFRVARGKRKG